MKFKTLSMSDHDLLIFFSMSNQFLAPGGLNAECVQVCPGEPNQPSLSLGLSLSFT